MKKKILFAIGAVCLFFASIQVQSQTKLTSGLKIAANRSNYIFRDLEYIKCSMGTGLSVGGLMNIGITECFSIQSELTLNYKVSEIGNIQSDVFVDYEYFSAELPVYAMLKKKLGQNEVFVGLGPYAGVGFSAKVVDFNLYDDEIIKPLDFGFIGTIGWGWGFGLQLYAGYQSGIINLIDVTDSDQKMKSQSFFVGVAYQFNRKKVASEEKIIFLKDAI